jgi:hypothetical protein
MKAERRSLVWRFIGSIAGIAATVGIANSVLSLDRADRLMTGNAC